MDALLDTDGLARLREALTSARYTSQGIEDLLGEPATAALARNDFRAALRRHRATATRWPRWSGCSSAARPSRLAAVAAALAPLPLDAALAAGLVERHGDGLRAGGRPGAATADWWVVADLSAGAAPRPAAARRPRARHRRRRPPPWPAPPSAARSAPRSTSAPAAACRRCTCPPTRRRVTATDLLRAGAALRRDHRRAQRPGLGAARTATWPRRSPGAASTWW